MLKWEKSIWRAENQRLFGQIDREKEIFDGRREVGQKSDAAIKTTSPTNRQTNGQQNNRNDKSRNRKLFCGGEKKRKKSQTLLKFGIISITFEYFWY